MKTTVVYVVSPGWEKQICVSIGSLFLSGSNFDRVKIFSVGGKIDLNFRESIEIDVEVVKDISRKYFLENKSRVCKVDSGRVVFIDADTIIINPIEEIWKNDNSDFIARPDQHYESDVFDLEGWRELLDSNDAKYGPYFNSGFFVFQNRSNKNVKWKEACKEFSKNTPSVLHGDRWVEQISLSVAVLRENLTYSVMDDKDHKYGWTKNPKNLNVKTTKLYHTGAAQFMPHLSCLYFEKNVNFFDEGVHKYVDTNIWIIYFWMLIYRIKYYQSYE